mmetsp:Transcript_14104/g.38623  ORF Transcript_14104/g.38623 Transcript_14104/m.38623 type:complete len:212 (+) Transcript_14104:310-945(+)
MEDFPRLDADVGCLPLCASERLVDHNARVREALAFSLGSCCQQKGAHRRGHPKADRLYFARNELHRVEDGQASRHGPPGRIDVHRDVFLGVLARKVQHLRDKHLRHFVFDLSPANDDAILQELRHHVQFPALSGLHHRHRRRHRGRGVFAPRVDLRGGGLWLWRRGHNEARTPCAPRAKLPAVRIGEGQTRCDPRGRQALERSRRYHSENL